MMIWAFVLMEQLMHVGLEGLIRSDSHSSSQRSSRSNDVQMFEGVSVVIVIFHGGYSLVTIGKLLSFF